LNKRPGPGQYGAGDYDKLAATTRRRAAPKFSFGGQGIRAKGSGMSTGSTTNAVGPNSYDQGTGLGRQTLSVSSRLRLALVGLGYLVRRGLRVGRQKGAWGLLFFSPSVSFRLLMGEDTCWEQRKLKKSVVVVCCCHTSTKMRRRGRRKRESLFRTYGVFAIVDGVLSMDGRVLYLFILAPVKFIHASSLLPIHAVLLIYPLLHSYYSFALW